MNKRFYVLTTQILEMSSPRNIRVDIGSPSDFLDWWRRNGLVEARRRDMYPFIWTYVCSWCGVSHPGTFRIVQTSASYAYVYVGFCLIDVKDIVYDLSYFERVFFGGASNPSRPHFGMCVTIDVK